MSQMIGLDSPIGVTLGYILHYLSLYSCPVEIFLKILIHLVGSWMDRILRVMGLVHDLAVKLKVFQNHKAVLKP
jgi:hypothetical protein